MEQNNLKNEYADTLLKLIEVDLPKIGKYNPMLANIIFSLIGLVLEQDQKKYSTCSSQQENNYSDIEISEKTKKEVDDIIAELEREE